MTSNPKDPGKQTAPHRKGARPLYRWSLTIALLFLTAWLLSNQDPEFLKDLQFDWSKLLLASCLLTLYTILLSERFRILTQLYLGQSKLSASLFLNSLVISRVLNGILPQAGNIYRGSQLLDRIGLPWSGYIVITITNIVIDIIVVSAVFLVVLTVTYLIQLNLIYFGQADLADILILTCVIVIISLLIIFHMKNKYRNYQSSNCSDSGEKSISALWRSIVKLEHLPWLILQSLTAVILLGVVLWLILVSMGFHPGLLGAATLMIAARAVQYIVITPGNLGVRELIYALVGSQLTIGIGAAVSASIILRIMNWIVLGLLLLISESFSSLRRNLH